MAIRPKIKTFGYATIIYGFSNLLTKIVAVTLIPLYTNYLSVYEAVSMQCGATCQTPPPKIKIKS